MQGKTEKKSWRRAAAALFSLIILGVAAAYTLRIALADLHYRANTLADLTRAAQLDPGNSRIWIWLAEHQEHAGLDPAAALETAARLSPFDSAPMIRLGLRAELAGHNDTAERLLLQAAATDKLYEPRWSLVNFYFRTGNKEKFWVWVRRALDMSYGDLAPLYRLCWGAGGDAALILRQIPDRRLPLREYLAFLLNSNRASLAGPAALRLIPAATAEDLPLLLGYLDQNPDLKAWNAMCERRLLPYPALDPERGPILTNADFANPPLLQGFDWRVTNTGEISAARTSPPGLRITLSGKQPESCELVSQPVPLVPGRRYRFRCDYQTAQVAPNSGLRWRIQNQSSGDLASAEMKTEVLDFTATEEIGALALRYNRAAGAMRIEGAIFLRHLAIDPLR